VAIEIKTGLTLSESCGSQAQKKTYQSVLGAAHANTHVLAHKYTGVAELTLHCNFVYPFSFQESPIYNHSLIT